jgi:hypothetical protein
VKVSRVRFDPSASIFQMSQFENLSGPQRVKAICVPAAFQSASASSFLGVSVSLVRSPVSGSTTHRSTWPLEIG